MATKQKIARTKRGTKDKPVDAEIRRAAERAGIKATEPEPSLTLGDRETFVRAFGVMDAGRIHALDALCGAISQAGYEVHLAAVTSESAGPEGQRIIQGALYGISERLSALSSFVLDHVDVEFKPLAHEAGGAS